MLIWNRYLLRFLPCNQQRMSLEKTARPAPSPQRILAIDALRGFDMFWILGADTLVLAWLGMFSAPWSRTLAKQWEHVPWEGFVFYDLIFPLFLFIVGCAIPFSLAKFRDQPQQAWWRILRRTALLILMGLIYNRILDFHFSELRWMGVLQRIGICYGVASTFYLLYSLRTNVLIFVSILLLYWAALAWIPNPHGIPGDYTPSGNIAGFVDRTLLPGKIMPQYYGYGDNEGLLSTIPAIATTLLGIFAGVWLQSHQSPIFKVFGLAAAGAASLSLGMAWGDVFPIIKNLWTSSFVLVAGGWSLILLALFYFIIDVCEWKAWAWIWVVIGANAITIYLLQEVVSFESIAQFFLNGTARWSGENAPMVIAAGALFAKWLLMAFLYRQRVFLRL